MWWGGVGCYDQLCCPASPKLLLGLDLGLGCDNYANSFWVAWSCWEQQKQTLHAVLLPHKTVCKSDMRLGKRGLQ